MPPKVLLRCSICGNFHASYLVEDKQLGKLKVCYKCWKARQLELAKTAPGQAAALPPVQAEGGKEPSPSAKIKGSDPTSPGKDF